MPSYYRINLKNKFGDIVYPNIHNLISIDKTTGSLNLLEGNLKIGVDQYFKDSKFGLDLNNSDVIGANGIYFTDLCSSPTEGIHFVDSSNTWDSLWAKDAKLYFSPTHTLTTMTNNLRVLTSGIGEEEIEGIKTIDLSDTTKYDISTWYPVVGSKLPYNGFTKINCHVQLDSKTKPSWSTHNNGFTCNLEVYAKANGWGTTSGQSYVTDYSYGFCSTNPLGYGQMPTGSLPVIWMRGGGKYFVRSSKPISWSIKTADYTINTTDTVSPVTACPGISISRTTIYADINGTASIASAALEMRLTSTNPTTGTWYYPVWSSGATEGSNYTLRVNEGLKYYTLEGTTSAIGTTILQVGNTTASGTAGNKQGWVRIHGPNTGYTQITSPNSTGNYTVTLPAKTGTVALVESTVAVHSGTSAPASTLGKNGDIYVLLSS